MDKMRKSNRFILAILVIAILLCGCQGNKNDGSNTTGDIIDNIDKEHENMGISLTIDIAQKVSKETYTHEKIKTEMQEYVQNGIKRIFFIPIPDTYASKESCVDSTICAPEISESHMNESVHHLLDPNLAFVIGAKNAGIEATVVYKPYETGGSVTIPAETSALYSLAGLATLGGNSIFNSLFCHNKDYLVDSLYSHSKVTSASSLRISKIELVFTLDTFTNEVGQGKNETIDPEKDLNIVPELWIGEKDNANYEKQTDFTYTVKKEQREFFDTDGNSLGKKNSLVLTIDVSKQNTSRYFAVTINNGNKLYTIPATMISGYNSKGDKVYATTAIYTRNPYSDEPGALEKVPSDYKWGSERIPLSIEDKKALDVFKAWGFEYEYNGIGSDFGDGWHNGYVYGIARGALMNMRGNLCEAYKAVQDYWLGCIDKYYAMGADRVLIGLENYGGMVSNYREFGYNTPIINRYKELYGQDPLKNEADYLKLMAIRGEFFLEFLESASALASNLGKSIGIEVFSAFEAPCLNSSLNGLCHYKMPKIVFDYKKAIDICDFVVIKDYNFSEYNAELAASIKEYAHSKFKSVLIVAYDLCSNDTFYMSAALNDEFVNGILVDYDIVSNELLSYIKSSDSTIK